VLAGLRTRRLLVKLNAVAVRYLIVDDSEEFLASAARLLESQGVKIVGCASTAAEALRLAAELAPDVALVDIELGDEDGFALAQQLASQAPSTRVVLISAYDREDLSELIAASPAVGFVPKRLLGATALEGLLG
jgi:two-component system, NarL family, nitrate/nitrite response regulator NarL